MLDTAQLTGEARTAAEQVQRLGLEPVAYQGDLVINGQSANGYIENGRVYFRTDARYSDGTAISPQSIVMHEAVHNAAQQNPGIVEQGMATVRQLRSEAEVQAMKEAYREAYKNLYDFETMSEAQIEAVLEQEIVADAYGRMNYFRDGADAQQAVQAALPQVMGQQTTETAQDTRGPPKASLRVFEDGQRFVEVDIDQKQFDGLTDGEKQRLAKNIILQKYAQKVTGTDNPAFVNRRSATEYAYPAKMIADSQIKDAKMRASTELDNLIDAGFNFRTAPDGASGHIHPNATGDFIYFDTIFKVGNEYYQGVINIQQTAKGKLFRDITKIRNVTQDIISSYGQSPKSDFLRDTSINSIRASSENSNKNLSGRASTEVPDADAQIREYMERHGYDKKFRYSQHLYQDYMENHGLLSQETDSQTDDVFSSDVFSEQLDSKAARTARDIQQALGTEAAIDYVAEQLAAGKIMSDEAYQIWQELRAGDGA